MPFSYQLLEKGTVACCVRGSFLLFSKTLYRKYKNLSIIFCIFLLITIFLKRQLSKFIAAILFSFSGYYHQSTLKSKEKGTAKAANSDAHGSSDLFGNDASPKVVDPSHNSCCFHLYKISLIYRFVLLVSANWEDLYR